MNEDEIRAKVLDEVLAMLEKWHDPYDYEYAPGMRLAIHYVEDMKREGGAA